MRFHHHNKSKIFQHRRPNNGLFGLKNGKSKSGSKKLFASTAQFSFFVIVAVFAVVGLTQTFGGSEAQADQFDDKIKALQKDIDGYNARANELAAQASTLDNKIKELQNQQAQLQAEINLNNTKRDDLTQQIADNEAKLQLQSEALSKTLAEIYYGQKTTALDVLMNSNSISDYVDKAARQDSMKDQISSSVAEIRDIKAQLEQQKIEVEKVIAQGEAQKASLIENQQRQQALLDQTQGQEAAYQEMITKTNAQKEQIQREQMAYIASLQKKYNSQTIANSQCGGGYPFCNAAPDSTQYSGSFRSYENARECVNYVQWRIFQITGQMERHGHANSWPRNLSQPVANSVGVATGGAYGHVVWVEFVGPGTYKGKTVGAGEIFLSEYNWSPFAYTERVTSASAYGYYKNW